MTTRERHSIQPLEKPQASMKKAVETHAQTEQMVSWAALVRKLL